MSMIAACRGCGSEGLRPAFFGAARRKSRDRAQPGAQFGEDFFFCDPRVDAEGCGLLQAAFERPGDGLERVACERSSAREAELKAFALDARRFLPESDGAVLDFASETSAVLGTLPPGGRRIALAAPDAGRIGGIGVEVVREGSPLLALEDQRRRTLFDLIVAPAGLDRAEAPLAVLRGLKRALSEHGVIMVEAPYLPAVLARTAVDALHADVRSVFSLASLQRIAEEAGLKVVYGRLSEAQGGSIRVALTRAQSTRFDDERALARLARIWDEEAALCLGSEQPYQAFAARARAAHGAASDFLAALRRDGAQAALLGASAREAALFRWFGADAATIPFAAAFDARDAGRRICRDGPEALAPGAFEDLEIDYLVTPWRLRRAALESARDAISAGMRLVFLLPELLIVDRANYAAELGRVLAGAETAGGVDTLKALLVAMRRPQLVSDIAENHVRAARG